MSSNPSGGAASYKLEIKPSAAKELESLGTKKDRKKIIARINALATDPRPIGSEKLTGEQNSYRVRQGNYRIGSILVPLTFPGPVDWRISFLNKARIMVKPMKKKFSTEVAPRITVDQSVMFGKPMIKGTRVPVQLVIGKLAGGMQVEEVMREYDLTRKDVLAALDYAAKLVGEEEIRVVK